MSEAKEQSSRRKLCRRASFLAAIVAALALAPFPLLAADDETARGPEILAFDTSLGRVDYHAGRGLRVGDTGLTLGGFATAQGERLEGEKAQGGLEGVNLLLFYDPAPFLHVFTEAEVAGLADWEDGRHGIRSNPGTKIERLYADVGTSDALQVRVGKFLTPIGRWNPVPAEPFVWTTSEPLVVEEIFDESVSGGMLWGSVFPRGGALSYSLYGTFLDPIAPDRENPPADHSAGAYLEWASLGGWSVGASYFASEAGEGSWNHLGGADFLWRPTERVELSGEALVGEGTRENGSLRGLYGQAVVETVPTLYAVSRYERFNPPGDGRAIDLVDLGLAWVPVYWLRVKADYRLADHFDEVAAPGLRSSLSVLF